MAKSTRTLDLHPVAKNSAAINAALDELLADAKQKRLKTVEIIPGKGSGQLMKRVKKYLNQKHVKAQYDRVVVDANNHGRLFVHFR